MLRRIRAPLVTLTLLSASAHGPARAEDGDPEAPLVDEPDLTEPLPEGGELPPDAFGDGMEPAPAAGDAIPPEDTAALGGSSLPTDPATTPPPEPEPDERSARFTGFPFAFYLPETSWGFGVGLGASLRIAPPENPEERRWFASNLTFGGAYTMFRQTTMVITPELYLRGGDVVVEGLTEIRNYPDRFYGLGRHTDRYYQTYTDISVRTSTTVRYHLGRGRYVGGVLDAAGTKIIDVATEDSGENPRPGTPSDNWLGTGAVNGEDESRVFGVGPAFVFDRRNSPYMTESGVFVRIASVLFPPFRERGAFARLAIDVRAFRPFFHGKLILAGQWVLTAASRNAPFNHLAFVGGPLGLRSFPTGRYRDNMQSFVQGELRFPLFWRFRLSLMTALGTLGGTNSRDRDPQLLWAAGGGIRVVLIPDRRLAVRGDVIFGPEEMRLLAFVHEAF